MKLVITGCGRSGTGYAAAILNRCGLRCGHEDVFNASTSTPSFRGFDADSSWLAVPWLHKIQCRAVHQIRCPLSVISSFVGIGFFSKSPKNKLLAVVNKYDGAILATNDPVLSAIAYWVRWNMAAEQRTQFRYRVEDLDPGVVVRMLGGRGRVSNDRILSAIATTSKTTNHRDHDVSLGWDDLPRSSITDHAKWLSERYGYAVG